MGLFVQTFAFVVCCTTVAIMYCTADSDTKSTAGLRKFVVAIYRVIYIGFLFWMIVGLISYLNGLTPMMECVDGDQTCISTDPFAAIKPNSVFNAYPLTFRNSRDTIRKYINDWADDHGYHAQSLDGGLTMKVSIVKYCTFIYDIYVQIRPCFKNRGFIGVVMKAHTRIGYTDFSATLDDAVVDLYAKLASMHRPCDYSFTMCPKVLNIFGK